uniref:HTH CENPB-type domain-containing protein n=1 Tax=Globisporangium ultimum (strain ATCC 200006 / CBS 805.95 / DAOM BR144) TaxID=431595 RepID=K3WA46_GLOUD
MAAGRARVHGSGRQQKQFKRASTSFQEKLAVIEHYDETHDMQATVRTFYAGLNETEKRAKARVIYRWIQQRESIAAHANSAKTKHQSRIRRVGAATTLGEDGEKEIVAWLNRLRRRGEQVSNEMLRTKALEVAKERNVPDGAFAASGTWQKSFIERNKRYLRDDEEEGEDEVDKSEKLKASEEKEGQEKKGHEVEAIDQAVVTPHKDYIEEDCALHVAAQTVSEIATKSRLSITPEVRVQEELIQVGETQQTQITTNAEVVHSSINEETRRNGEKSAEVEVEAVAVPEVVIQSGALDPVQLELLKRKAEIEDRKAQLLNESIHCDNVLKRIRIAEENMLARKRLKDAGVSQEEIDALLPVVVNDKAA